MDKISRERLEAPPGEVYTETILAARSTLPSGVTLLNKPVSAHHLLAAVARSIASRHEPAAS